MEEIVEGKMK